MRQGILDAVQSDKLTKNTKEGIVMGLGMDMERDELLEDRAAFTAGG